AYNQIVFAGVGHPADIEKLRKSVIDIAHLEAFNLSAGDVSLQRLVNFGVGPLMKTAFDEIFRSPFIARILVAELDPSDERETFCTVDADGTFAGAAEAAVIAGVPHVAESILAQLPTGSAPAPLNQALATVLRAWGIGRLANEVAAEDSADSTVDPTPGPSDDQIATEIDAALETVRLEAAVLDRTLPTKSKFRLLDAESLQAAVDVVKAP
ncbi:MAG: hypothetical protein HOH74_20985, partial [Gemmatimonadetes bacterium]|nr:hypothetical protein [Gemmatimonadota bacterium]